MASDEPYPERDVKDFRYQQLCRFQIDEGESSVEGKSPQLIAASSKYDVFCVGTRRGFKVLKTSELSRIDQQHVKDRTKVVIRDYPCLANVQLSVPPSFIALSSDSLSLAVAVETDDLSQLFIYDVRCFLSQGNNAQPFLKIRLSCGLVDLAWNPESPAVLACVLLDGSIELFEAGNNLQLKAKAPPNANATCVCWSPKGKQLVVGRKDGMLAQYDQALVKKKEWTCPDLLSGPQKVVGVCWLSTFSFMVAYLPHDAESSDQPTVVMITGSKESPPRYTSYEDPCYGGGEDREKKYFFHYIPGWEMISAISSTAIEIVVLGKHMENKDQVERWNLEDSARAEIPLKSDHSEAYSMGVAFDFSSQVSLPLSDERSLPPCPIMLVLSSDGILIPFYMVYTHPEAQPLTKPPETLTAEGARQPSGVVPTGGSQNQTSQPPAPSASPASSFQFMSSVVGQSQPPKQEKPPTFGGPSFQFVSSTPSSTPQPPSFSFSASNKPVTTSTQEKPAPPIGFTFGKTKEISFGAKPSKSEPSTVKPSSMGLTTTKTQEPVKPSTTAATPAFGSGFNLPPATKPTSLTPATISTSLAPATSFNMSGSAGGLVNPVSAGGLVKPGSTNSQPTASKTSTGAKFIGMNLPPPQEAEERQNQDEEPTNLDSTYTNSLIEEIGLFEEEMKQFRARTCIKNPLSSIGTVSEMEKMKKGTETMTEFSDNIKKVTKEQNKEVEDIRSVVLDCFSMAEECKLREQKNADPKYLHLLRSKTLDPANQERLRTLQQRCQMLDRGLRECDHILDNQWQEYQIKNKKQARIMSPTTDLIYRSIKSNKNIIVSQRVSLDDLESQLKQLKIYNKTSAWQDLLSETSTELSSLADSLLESKTAPLSSSRVSVPSSPEKMARLREHLSRRSVPKIKSTRPNQAEQSFIQTEMRMRTRLQSQPVSSTPLPGHVAPQAAPFRQPVQVVKQPFSVKQPANIVSQTAPARQPGLGFAVTQATSVKQPGFGFAVSQAAPVKQHAPSLSGSIQNQALQLTGPAISFKQGLQTNQTAGLQPNTASNKPVAGLFNTSTSSGTFGMSAGGKFTLPVSAPVQNPAYEDITPPSSTGYEEEDEETETETNEDEDDDNGVGFGLHLSQVPQEGDTTESETEVLGAGVTSTPLSSVRQQVGKEGGLTSKNLFGTPKSAAVTPIASNQPMSLFGRSSASSGFSFGGSENGGAIPKISNTFSLKNSGETSTKQEAQLSSTTTSESKVTSSSSGETKTTVAGSSAPTSSFMFGQAGSATSAPSTGFNFSTKTTGQDKNAGFNFASKPLDKNMSQGATGFNFTSTITDKPKDALPTDPSLSFTAKSESEKTQATKDKKDEVSSTTESAKPSSKGDNSTVSRSLFGQSSSGKAPLFGQSSENKASSLAGLLGSTQPDNEEVSSSDPGFTGNQLSVSSTGPGFTVNQSSVSSTGPGTTVNQSSVSSTSSGFATNQSSVSSSGAVDETLSKSKAERDQSGKSPNSRTGQDSSASDNQTVSSSDTAEETKTVTSSSQPTSLLGQTNTPPTGLFGQTTTASTGLFGQQNVTTSGASSTNSTTASSNSGGLFGQPAVSGGLFGKQTPTSSGGLFGQPAASTGATGLFGQTAASTSATGLFGQPAASTSATGLFGQPAASTSTTGLFGQPTATTSTTGLFGQPAASTSTSGLFGQPTATTSTTGLFGQPASSASSTSSGGLFGQTTASTNSGGLFGKPAVSSSSGGLFGQPSMSSSTGGLFGQSAAATTSSSPFGQASSAPTSNQPSSSAPSFGGTSGGLFGKPATSGGGLFGTPATSGGVFGQTSSSSGTGLFGQSVQTSGSGFGQQSTPGSGFGQSPAFGQSTPTSGFGQSAFAGSTFGQPTSTSGAGGNSFGGSSFCGLGGQASAEKANTNVFGSVKFGNTSQASTGSLFGSQANTNTGFGVKTSGSFGGGGSFTGGGSVASTGFGVTSQQGSSSGFGSPPSFGGSPSFGGTAFGAKPAFGTSPSFGGGATFGSQPTFGGSPAGGFGSPQQQQTGGFGGFGSGGNSPAFEAIAGDSSVPTFGALSQGFGGGPSPGFGGGTSGGFGGTQPSGFGTQSPPNNPSFTGYRS